ncbi:MAG: hypothetical protein AUK44_00005 [Porphyromonadaceae bacterium CG2_30_38_12]|nr:MAG: hypothetical protein AUK44_00005 [Porphyromonadaceae bacterium CG2_30_38_12]
MKLLLTYNPCVNRNILIIVILICLQSTYLQAQTEIKKITLKSGSTYIGEIIVSNDELVMIKDVSGARFQFATSEVVSIEKTVPNIDNKLQQNKSATVSKIAIQLAGTVFTASAQRAFENYAGTEIALIAGNKKAFGKDVFLGLGIGYLSISGASKSQQINLLPVFFNMQTYTSKNLTSGYFGLDAGYAFEQNGTYQGGMFANIAVGIRHRLNYQTSLQASIFSGVQTISGTLQETTSNGTFLYSGNTTMSKVGLKIEIQF